jgi:hypothetical protein
MFPICHPCIDVNERKSFGGLSHHLVEVRTNTKKGITKKHAILQHWKDRMLFKIKGYVKPIEHQFEVHMVYDGKNKDTINPNGKHQ